MVLHKLYVGIQPRNVITCGSRTDHASLNEDVEILNEVRIHCIMDYNSTLHIMILDRVFQSNRCLVAHR